MKRVFALICLLLALAVPASATASASPAKLRIGRVALTPPVDGRSSLLISASYPIEMVGHRLLLRVSLFGGDGELRDWVVRPLASGGRPRSPDRRRRFGFVHRVVLDPQTTKEIGSGLLLGLHARAGLDIDGEGKPEFASNRMSIDEAPRKPGGKALCATVPQRRARPGRKVAVALPVCTSSRHWRIAVRPAHGSATIRDGMLVYRSAAKFRGTDSLRLSGGAPVVFKVGTEQGAAVRAIGDSVTAGFGYYDNGTPMKLTSLFDCKPGAIFFNDACSSNSAGTDSEGTKVEYAPDYGLANNISWAAQWSNDHGIANYENLAVSGSTPADWLPGGQLYKTLQGVEAEDPDYILMTMGANPILSETLFGIDRMGCAIWSDLFGKYRECIEEAFAKVALHERLESLYRELVANTSATIYLMQYHLSIPSSALAYTATQIAEMAAVMNGEIAAVAKAVNPKRLRVVSPPHFDVGVSLEPVYPSGYSCSRLGYKVDGPSVQTGATQVELGFLHPLSFCKGPLTGPPWVISGDTGIHPSAAGYAQMASQVPAPE